jgi:hypothetical protein
VEKLMSLVFEVAIGLCPTSNFKLPRFKLFFGESFFWMAGGVVSAGFFCPDKIADFAPGVCSPRKKGVHLQEKTKHRLSA